MLLFFSNIQYAMLPHLDTNFSHVEHFYKIKKGSTHTSVRVFNVHILDFEGAGTTSL